jgi:TonB family protein
MPVFSAYKRPEFTEGTDSEDEDYDFRYEVELWLRSVVAIPDGFKISMSFIIEKSGTLSNVKIISTSDEGMASKVVAALETSPKWTPASDANARPVRMFLHMSRTFSDRDKTKVDNDDMDTDKGDVMPSFANGDLNTFRRWVMQRLVYPAYAVENGIEGMVLMTFIVEKDGKVTVNEIIHSPHQLLTDAVLDVLKRSPEWSPGIRNGEPVRVYYLLPTDFVYR